MLFEPPATQYDLNFKLFGIPVRVHPMFWLIALILGANGNDVAGAVTWMLCLFVSILIHEMGHAVAIRCFGDRPRIILYGMGGLATYHPTTQSPKSRITIAFAGPLAGFLFAAIIIGTLMSMNAGVGLFGIQFGNGDIDLTVLRVATYLLYINIFWGMVNLLPVFPLDGGQISREVFMMFSPRRGVVWSLKLSIGMCAATAAAALYFMGPNGAFIALMFAMLGFNAYNILKQYRQGYGRSPW